MALADGAFGEAEANRRVRVEGWAGVASGGRSARGSSGTLSLLLCD